MQVVILGDAGGDGTNTVKYASAQINMKFHLPAWQAKTYLDLGGHHIQFNVVSTETLRDAQRHPETYRDLIVRIAGFSAYFNQLHPLSSLVKGSCRIDSVRSCHSGLSLFVIPAKAGIQASGRCYVHRPLTR